MLRQHHFYCDRFPTVSCSLSLFEFSKGIFNAWGLLSQFFFSGHSYLRSIETHAASALKPLVVSDLIDR